MQLTNPEAFRFEAANIFVQLSDTFPSLADWEYDQEIDGYPTLSGKSREQIQFETMKWLIDHHYIHCESGYVGKKWKGLQLTERAIGAMREQTTAAPSEPRKSVAVVLREAVFKFSVEVTSSLMAKVLTEHR